MKKVLNRSWLLPALIISLLSAGVFAAEAPKKLENKAPVYAVRGLTLKADVKADEFEKFVREEFNAAFKAPLGGMRMVILKADRGQFKGSYLLLWEFASIDIRAKYYPEEDKTPTEEAQKAINEVLKPAESAYEKLGKYVDIADKYTDYVTVL